MFDRIDRLVGAVSRMMAVAGAALSGGIALMIVASVVSRAVSGIAITGTVDVVQTMMVATIILSVPYGMRKGTHIELTLVTERMPGRLARIARGFGLAVSAAILAWATQASSVRALRSIQDREVSTGVTEFPVWPARVVLAMGLAWFCVETLILLARLVRGEQVASEAGPSPANDLVTSGSVPPEK